jgi:hypothetical protein
VVCPWVLVVGNPRADRRRGCETLDGSRGRDVSGDPRNLATAAHTIADGLSLIIETHCGVEQLCSSRAQNGGYPGVTQRLRKPLFNMRTIKYAGAAMDPVGEKVVLITGAANGIGAEVASDRAPRKNE